MRIGNARIDFDGNLIDGFDGPSIVEPKVMQLLKVLAEKPNTVFSREELITAVWGVDFGGDERLSRAISLLRKALGDKRGHYKYIETISRRGYRLIAEVAPETPGVLSPPDINQVETTPPSILAPPKLSPKSKSKSVKGLTAALSLAVTITLGLIIFILSRGPIPLETLSVGEELTAGFEKIHNFGHVDAVEEAQSHFQSVLKREPENATAHAGLALAYIREFTSAESDPALIKNAKSSALRALKHNEHLALSYIAMAWAAEFDNERANALQYLERADSLDEDNPLTLESRFRLLGSSGDLDGAEALIIRSISLYPDNALFQSNAAKLYVYNNDLPKAERYSKRAIELDPENPWFYASAAQILHLQNKTSEAVKIVQNGLERSESAALYNNLGTYLFFDGNYELAASAFEKTLRLDGNTHDPQFWANLGDAYRWTNGKQDKANQNYKRAVQIWKESLKSRPEDVDLRTRIALYEAKMSSGERPTPLLRQVLSQPELSAIQYYRALVTAEIWGDRDLSLGLLQRAIDGGYPLKEIQNDPELRALRQDQGYHLIVSE
ncbi:hypothetical protein GCM10011309_25020 [Litorimonas cladophorae]|uniref:OmpR/PhoB-type domain-containing protein n=1 Tax=Litorimonas cladophorae TaxID=1220491 RepID=A0A918NHP1_9PROT|nr:winged helix-turn-helix domain-containing protein [Litorimonas cladophorae]GGX73897.1 hypothetical protein GCM10011309_25020 [Litorimonas cladophorae]